MDGELTYPGTAVTAIRSANDPVIRVNLVKARAVVVTAASVCAHDPAEKSKGGVSPDVW